jgi:hypothetical protein
MTNASSNASSNTTFKQLTIKVEIVEDNDKGLRSVMLTPRDTDSESLRTLDALLHAVQTIEPNMRKVRQLPQPNNPVQILVKTRNLDKLS